MAASHRASRPGPAFLFPLDKQEVFLSVDEALARVLESRTEGASTGRQTQEPRPTCTNPAQARWAMRRR